MGSHSSKAAKGEAVAQDAAAVAAAGDASPAKSNGQENGHVKVNGDVSPKADGEVSSLNGGGSAEAPKELAKAEMGSGDAIEPAPVAEGEAKPDGAASAKQTPKKKKRFSFKKSFKLSGISFRKAKKEAGDASAACSPSEEQQQQGKAGAAEAEDQPATAAAEEGEQPSVPQEEAVAPEETPAAASAPDNEPVAKEGPAKEEEQAQQPPSAEGQGDVKPEETSTSAEVEPSAAADQAAAAEQKEE